MFRKSIIVLVLVILINFIIDSCWCPDPETYYHNITNIEILNTQPYEELEDSSTINSSNYRIKCKMDVDMTTYLFSPFFYQAAYATSCVDYFVGLRSDITKFEITCNKSIGNIGAGEQLNINDNILIYDRSFIDDSKNERMSIEDWLDLLNNGGYQLAYQKWEWYFEFKNLPSSNEYLKFKFLFLLENGEKYEIETNSIRIND